MMSAASILLFYGGQSLSADSANYRLGSGYAAEGLEAARAVRNRNWSELATGTHGVVYAYGNWQFASSSQDSNDIFTRTVTVTDAATNTKNVVSAVTWTTDPKRPQKIELTEQMTNWKNAFSGGCVKDVASGNWSNPQVLGSADIGSGNAGTDIAVKLPYVFVSGTASSASKPDLFVFDVTNVASPQLVKSIDIGAGGINSIFIKDNYLYAASSNDLKEFIVFDITAPPNTSMLASMNLPGPADAIGITAFASTTAVGRTPSADYELTFINVNVPAAPSIISQVVTGGNIYDFYSTDRRLYFTSEDSDPDIWVYDITTPSNPVFITNYDIPGVTYDISLYLMEKGGTTILDGNHEDELLSIGATTTSQMYLRDRLDVGGDVNDIICVTGDIAFLATSNSGKEFYIADVSNPDDLREKASLNFPQVGTGIDFKDNKAFFSVRSNDALRIIGPGP